MPERLSENLRKDLLLLSQAPQFIEWQFSHIRPHLGRRILEIGSGTGNISEHIARTQPELFLPSDLMPCPFDDEQIKKYPDLKRNYLQLDVEAMTDNDILELELNELDTVVASNVLEHIEDDLQVLVDLKKIILPGGKIVCLTPAHPMLYSGLDKNYGHFRRYNRRQIFRLAEEAEVDVISFSYWNMLGFFAWFIEYKLLGSQSIGMRQIRLANSLSPALSSLESSIWKPFGMSAVFVFQKADM